MAENRIENSRVRKAQQRSDIANTSNLVKDSTARDVEQHINTKRRSTAVFYAALSLVFLGLAILIGWWIFERATQLGPRFLLAYYGALVVLGISAAVVLFGSMRSYAALTGHHGPITGEVGGPAALFILVVVGAFVLAKPAETFTLVVRLTGASFAAGSLDNVVVTVDLGQRLESKPVSATGEAYIPEVSTSLIGKAVPVSLSPGRVHKKDPDQPLTIPAEFVLYVPVSVDPPASTETASSSSQKPVIGEIDVNIPYGFIMEAEAVSGGRTFSVYAQPSRTIARPISQPAQDVILSFDITNPNHNDLRISAVYVEVVEFIPVRVLETTPVAAGGHTWRLFCNVRSSKGRYKAELVSDAYDYIKLSDGEMERLAVHVNSPDTGIYSLGLSVEYAIGSTPLTVDLGRVPRLVGFF
jgi:hypothetical protein